MQPSPIAPTCGPPDPSCLRFTRPPLQDARDFVANRFDRTPVNILETPPNNAALRIAQRRFHPMLHLLILAVAAEIKRSGTDASHRHADVSKLLVPIDRALPPVEQRFDPLRRKLLIGWHQARRVGKGGWLGQRVGGEARGNCRGRRQARQLEKPPAIHVTAPARIILAGPVSYNHLTTPTILSV